MCLTCSDFRGVGVLVELSLKDIMSFQSITLAVCVLFGFR